MVVTDASVLMNLVAPEPDSDRAVALRTQELCAPELWIAETASVLWRKARLGEITQDEAVRFHNDLLSGGIRPVPMEKLGPALHIALAIGHSVYDCCFLEAAVQNDTQLITSDARFAHAVRQHRKWARHIRLLQETA